MDSVSLNSHTGIFSAMRRLRVGPSAYRLIVLLLSCPIAACSQIDYTQPIILVAAQRHEISADIDFEVNLELFQDTNLIVSAAQENIDVNLSVKTPDGRLLSVNNAIERDGTESILIRSATAGDYHIRIYSNDHRNATGHAFLRIRDLQQRTTGDKLRINAEHAISEGGRLNFEADLAEDSTEKFRLQNEAIEQYQQAARLWARMSNSTQQALALYCAASLNYVWAEWRTAAESALQAAKLLADNHEYPRLRARILHLQGQSLLETEISTDIDLAMEVLQEALDIQRSEGDQFNAAVTINTLGILGFQRGDLLGARKKFSQAGHLLEAVGEDREASKTFNNVAKIDEKLGYLLMALDSYDKALELVPISDDPLLHAEYLENSADAHAILGNMQEALLRYHDTIQSFREIGDRGGEARALDGLGVVYLRLGDWNMAARYFKESLAAQTGPTEIRPLAETYTKLGNTYRALGETTKAIESHNTALRISGRRAEQATAHLELGRDYAVALDESTAMTHFNNALKLANGFGAPLIEAYALTERGTLLISRNIESGIAELNSALIAHRSLRSDHGEAQTLAALARAHQVLGETQVALTHANDALKIVEELRYRAGNPRLRYAFTGAQWPTYELVINLTMDLHQLTDQVREPSNVRYDALALEISERAHARTLAELLYEGPTQEPDIEIDPLRAQHLNLRRQLAQAAFRRTLSSDNIGENASAIDRDIASLITQINVIEARIRDLNPAFEIEPAKSLTVSEIQRQLRNESETRSSVLLEYSLGDRQSVLWAVTENSVDSWILPGRQEIEELAREVYAELKSPPAGVTQSAERLEPALQTLSKLLLGPAEDQLHNRRVVVVPDGALHYLPFGALVVPSTNQFLIEQAEVITLPSASVLAVQRARNKRRDNAPSSIVIVADPVFTAWDPRLVSRRLERQPKETERPFSSMERGRTLSRLPYTAEELKTITEIAERAQQNVLPLTGFEASRAVVLAASLQDHRIIHFASHGLIDSQQPELSAIALSAYNKAGQVQPNLLQLADIYALSLEADLVVLSACDTALGTNVRGEGLVGLVHAFMYAGAQGVIATTWSVQDRATAELMRTFYEKLLRDDFAPSAALRFAQLSIASDRRWEDPYYWAPFVYQGEWNL